MAGIKGKPSKKEGMGFQHLPKSAEEIAELVERARSLRQLLIDINGFLTFQDVEGGMGKLENNLTKIGDTWISKRERT